MGRIAECLLWTHFDTMETKFGMYDEMKIMMWKGKVLLKAHSYVNSFSVSSIYGCGLSVSTDRLQTCGFDPRHLTIDVRDNEKLQKSSVVIFRVE